MTIELPKSIIQVLNNSEYKSDYFISKYDRDEIIQLYEKYGFQLDNALIEIISVFGNRVIYYYNDSIPNRIASYELNFSIGKVLGKYNKRRVLLQYIQYYCSLLNVNSLIPIAVMPSGTLTYYASTDGYIYAVMDNIFLLYKGDSLWNSLEKIFQGQYLKLDINKY